MVKRFTYNVQQELSNRKQNYSGKTIVQPPGGYCSINYLWGLSNDNWNQWNLPKGSEQQAPQSKYKPTETRDLNITTRKPTKTEEYNRKYNQPPQNFNRGKDWTTPNQNYLDSLQQQKQNNNSPGQTKPQATQVQNRNQIQRQPSYQTDNVAIQQNYQQPNQNYQRGRGGGYEQGYQSKDVGGQNQSRRTQVNQNQHPNKRGQEAQYNRNSPLQKQYSQNLGSPQRHNTCMPNNYQVAQKQNPQAQINPNDYNTNNQQRKQPNTVNQPQQYYSQYNQYPDDPRGHIQRRPQHYKEHLNYQLQPMDSIKREAPKVYQPQVTQHNYQVPTKQSVFNSNHNIMKPVDNGPSQIVNTSMDFQPQKGRYTGIQIQQPPGGFSSLQLFG